MTKRNFIVWLCSAALFVLSIRAALSCDQVERIGRKDLTHPPMADLLVPPPVTRIPVFYATDRQTITHNLDEAGHKLAPLHLGIATAIVPTDRSAWLNTASPPELQPKFQRLGWQLDSEHETLKPYLEVRGYVAELDPAKVLCVPKTEVSEQEFWTTLGSDLNDGEKKSVYVYIHGFACSGDNAVYTSGILASALQAPVICFTWPSLGSAGIRGTSGQKGIKKKFAADIKTIDSPQVMDDLATTIANIRARLGPHVAINLIAHSLGNRLMNRYFAAGKNGDLWFDKVYFLAPDVNKKDFLAATPNLLKSVSYCAVYTNPSDRVLLLSSLNALTNARRPQRKLGRAKIDALWIEFIDYEAIAEPKGREYAAVRHYIPFENFGLMVRQGVPAPLDDHGHGSYGLYRRTRIVPTAPANNNR